MPAAVACLLALEATGLWRGAWPCAITCEGGARYAAIHGLPLPVVASLGWIGLLLAVGATRWRPPQIEHQRSAPTPRYLELAVWLAAGASLFFVWTAWRLRMPCSACGAYHTAALSAGGALRAGRLRLGPRWLALLAGACAPMLIFGWHLLRDVEPGASRQDPGAVSAWQAAADQGRAWGDAHAPLRLDLALDVQCSACADEFPRWEDALAPLISDGSLRVRIVFVTRPSEPAGPTLDAWILAAGGHGRSQRALRALLGTRTDATVAEAMRSPASELIDLGSLAAEADAHRADADALLADDARALKELRYDGKTPLAVLSAVADHRVCRRWSGSLDADDLAAEVRRQLNPGAPHG